MDEVPRAERRPHVVRRADSRAVILDAAVRALVEYGYGGATTVVIQRLAGVSRGGRLLHYFPSREELLVAAAQHLAVERISEMERWFDAAPEHSVASPQRIDYAVVLLWRTFQQPYFWAAMELWLAARTDPHTAGGAGRIRAATGARDRARHRDDVRPVHSSHAGFADLRELLFTSMRGGGAHLCDRRPRRRCGCAPRAVAEAGPGGC